MYLFCVDPGTRVAGFAVFRIDTRKRTGEYIRSGWIAQRTTLGWLSRTERIIAALESKLRAVVHEAEDGVHVVSEMPEVFGSRRGAAANNSGSVMKLTFFVGAFWRMAQGIPGVKAIELAPVSKWKGQVPKHITQKRVTRAWGWRGEDDNEADAVGIGDWWVRKVKKFKAVR